MVDGDGPARAALEGRLARLQDLERDRRFHAGHVACDLRAIEAVLDRLGRPQEAFGSIHVTGSWGKGSTATFAASILEAAGWRVGLYTSPHLIDPCERVRLGGRAIHPAVLAEHLDRVESAARRSRMRLTYFEAMTAAAFSYFRQEGCPVAVVEVGLGGRLDATNTVCPLASAVTAVNLEHARVLGASIEAIAGEKAGILRAGRPVVLGSLAEGPRRVILEKAGRLGCPVLEPEISVERLSSGEIDLRVGLEGRADLCLRLDDRPEFLARCAGLGATLARLAHSALGGGELGGAGLGDALQRVFLPGRTQIVGRAPWVLVDGAHSPQGVLAVLEEAKRRLMAKPLFVVLGLLADKEAGGILRAVSACDVPLVLTRPPSPRARDPFELADLAAGRGLGARVVEDPSAALCLACSKAGPRGAVVVTGSLYLAGLHVDPADVQDIFDRRGGDGTGQPYPLDRCLSGQRPSEDGHQETDELPQQSDAALRDSERCHDDRDR